MKASVWSTCAFAFALCGCEDVLEHPEAGAELERALEAQAEASDEVVARVNGKALTASALHALWTQRPELDRAEALEELVVQELLAREGMSRGLASPALEDGRKRGLSRALIEREFTRDASEASEAIVSVFREREAQKLARPSGLVASHLLVRTTSDPKERIEPTEAQRARMSSALERARALLPKRPEPIDLRSAARELEGQAVLGDDLMTHVDVRMTFPRLGQAGELPSGWVALVPPFVEASAQAADDGRLGEVVGPVDTPFGAHLIVVHERLDAPELDAEQVEALAREAANDAELGTRFEAFVAELRGAKSWAVFPEALLEDAAGGS